MLKSKNIPTLTGAAAAALTSLAMTQAALAAGPIPVATPEPVVIGSTGQWYAGVEAGTSSGAKYSVTGSANDYGTCDAYSYGDGTTAVTENCSENGTGAPDPDGTALGLFVGYNTVRGNTLLGGEFRAMSFSDPDAVDILPALPGFLTVKAGFGNLYELRARVGSHVGEKAMVYGSLGIARATFDVEACVIGTCATTSVSDTAPSAGLGIEYDLTDKTFLGADYSMRQFEFGSDEVDLNTLTLRLGYRF